MAGDDQRYYETFYGIHVDDWSWNFGTFTDHHKVLTKEYLNEGCACTETSEATDTNEFLYPHHIKKKYFIEGVISGHITLAASSATVTVTSFKVTVGKVNQETGKEELFTTGWITVNTTLTWNATYSVGDERVYPFWIDAWDYEELSEYDRIYVKVETNADDDTVLWHSNDATWEDIKITIPLRL